MTLRRWTACTSVPAASAFPRRDARAIRAFLVVIDFVGATVALLLVLASVTVVAFLTLWLVQLLVFVAAL